MFNEILFYDKYLSKYIMISILPNHLYHLTGIPSKDHVIYLNFLQGTLFKSILKNEGFVCPARMERSFL